MRASTDSTKKIQKLERRIIRASLVRAREWLKSHPEGLVPLTDKRAMRSELEWKLAKAVLDLLAVVDRK